MFRNSLAFVIAACLSSSLFGATRAPCSIQRAASIASNVWLLCDRGSLYVSPDVGATWQMRRLPPDVTFRAIAFLDARRGFVAGDQGSLFATENGAETWRKVEIPVQENLTSIHFAGQSGWAAGWAGVILHTRDGGRTWQRQQSGVNQALDDVFFVDENHGWAVGWVGTIVRTTNGGEKWEGVKIPNTLWSLNSVYFTDPQHGWAVGFGGLILTSADGGLTWQARESNVQKSLKSIGLDPKRQAWIAADDRLLTTADNGTTWVTVPVADTLFLQQIVVVKDAVWAIGQFGVLRQTSGKDFALISTLPEREATGRT